MSDRHHLSIHECRVRQVCELPSGHVLPLEIELPVAAFAIVHEHQGQLEVVALCKDERTALARCRAIAEQVGAKETDLAAAEGHGGRLN